MRILLVQTAFLGDAILATPLIKNLSKMHPGAELWVMTTPLASELIERDPLVAGVIPFDKRGEYSGMTGLSRFAKFVGEKGFDRVYSLHRSFRTALMLRLAGISVRTGFRDAVGSFLYNHRVSRKPYPHAVLRSLSLIEDLPGYAHDQDLRLFAPDRDQVGNVVSELDLTKRTAAIVPGSVWATKRWSIAGFQLGSRGVAP